jgi:hypothetical protein
MQCGRPSILGSYENNWSTQPRRPSRVACSSLPIRHPDRLDHRPITKFSFCSRVGPTSLQATARRTQGDVVRRDSALNILPWTPPSYMSRSILSQTTTPSWSVGSSRENRSPSTSQLGLPPTTSTISTKRRFRPARHQLGCRGFRAAECSYRWRVTRVAPLSWQRSVGSLLRPSRISGTWAAIGPGPVGGSGGDECSGPTRCTG